MVADITPLFISSGDLIADRRYGFAVELAKRGDLADAADLLTQTLERVPGFASGWFALAAIRDVQGDREGAVDAFRAAATADPQDRHGAGLHLARLGGSAPNPAHPQAYIRSLFDQQAPRFDAALRYRLNYRGPQLIAAALAAACETLHRSAYFDRALDLGCGTGLVGRALSRRIDSLVGVDLSPGMLAEAERTGVYNHLHVGELGVFLASERPESADLVIAADVLVYVPDLVPTCAAVARVLEPGGLFVCTLERHDGDGVRLLDTLRYAHSAAHTRGALDAAGLAVVTLDAVSFRTEKGEPVPGLIVVAQRPPDPA